jgi:hypothetical protein
MMKLEILDIRNNSLNVQYSWMFDYFLKDTVVFMWGNPNCLQCNFTDMNKEFSNIAATGKFHSYYHPLKIGEPTQELLS